MRIALAVLITLHGLIHVLGAAKAFGWVDVGQLHAPISSAAGVLWLSTAVLLIVAAAVVARGVRWWWYAALPGVLLSQARIASAWSDARFGTIANLVIAIPLLLAVQTAERAR